MSRSGSATPKNMPTAVKIPCQARAIGPRCTFGSSGISITDLAPVTLLEFLPGPAPARLVTAGQLLGRRDRRRHGTTVAARPRRERRRRGGGARAVLLLALRLRRGLDRDPEDRLRHAARDPRRHLLEERVRLALVGNERILLAIP